MHFRIAHFSDFHLTRLNNDFQRAFALIDDAISQDVDHLVVTGDIVESGQMGVVGSFFAALKQRRWASARRLTIIPENHDIFPASVRAIPSLSRPTQNFNRFAEITRPAMTRAGVRRLLRGQPYPFAKILNEDVVLVGMDTTRNGQYNPLRWAEGELSEEARNTVTEFFDKHSKAKYRIVAMHHHPTEENCVHGWIGQNFTTPPAEEIEAWLTECGATLVLCGHIHTEGGIEKQKLGKSGHALRCGASGGVDESAAKEDRAHIYHLIDLLVDGKKRFIKKKYLAREL